MTYNKRFEHVITSGRYPTDFDKLSRLAQLVYSNQFAATKELAVEQAIARFEDIMHKAVTLTDEEVARICSKLI